MNDLQEQLRLQMEALLTPAVPAQVTRYQAREALRRTPSGMPGVSLFDQVEAMAQQQGGDLLRAWQEVGSFVRSSSMVNDIGTALGQSPQQMDDLFRLANSIVV